METNDKKILVVFDFDHTIIEENSDVVILKLLSEMGLNDLASKREQSLNWAHFMQEVYKKMTEENIKIDQIKEIVENLEFNSGIPDLFDFIKSNKIYFDTLIISGSNTLFIDWKLQKHNLTDLFPVYFSNIAEPCEHQIIKIDPYHKHDCLSCDQSQCKRIIMREHLELQKEKNIYYKNLFFVGDGLNDFCPATIFKETDLLFPRYEFPLYKKLYLKGFKEKLKCGVHSWKDGFKIIEIIKNLI
jgi:pyridoxal phosphate phosphatase PHOSPHO2